MPHVVVAMDSHLLTGLQSLSRAFELAMADAAESAGRLAMSALKVARRDEMLLTQGLLRQQAGSCIGRFEQSLKSQWDPAQSRPKLSLNTDWDELSLVEEEAVDQLVVADRIGMALSHHCEWELRAVEAFTASLLGDPSAGPDKNPFRPAMVARALLAAVDSLTDQTGMRQTLSEELTRALALRMPTCYTEIAATYRTQGLRAQDLRAVTEPGGLRGGGGHHSRPMAMDPPESSHAPISGPGGLTVPGGLGPQGSSSHGGPYGAAMLGHVGPQVMGLLRQLHIGQAAPVLSPMALGDAGLPLPTNLIQQHSTELHQAASTPLDHMVIDVVGGLFDAILSDPKVPPQMARLLARLQLPVLRAALGDTSFFSMRKHPVRRFVNRLASLACAYEDFSQDPGLGFLQRVAPLVEEIANGDFEKVKLYDEQLDALEAFVAEQNRLALQREGQDAAELLAKKEALARQTYQYQQELERALADLPLPDFLKRFLSRDWGPVIVHAATQAGDAEAQGMRRLGKELALSVLPKGGSPLRREFLSTLPVMVRAVNEGLDRVGSPEAVRKQLFVDLLPIHAESLKQPALSPLDHNLLVKRIEAAFGLAVPDEAAAARATATLDIDLEQVFGAAGAEAVGLLSEADVAWDGTVDIVLEADGAPEAGPLAAVDIAIDGLPAPEAPPVSRGAALFEQLEVGCVYRMNTGDSWRKVKLAHISQGRSFFIFSEGEKYPKTLTMTARMLKRLCESERLRAYESAQLLERATARARKQLAALLPPTTPVKA
ncbi:MAG: DUF1631 family protein [Inhella sp.]|uniref:DUF1631 family protein n=1 Tax=Inhella sp. TaxID=1921806 RepID=UPI0039197659